MADFGKTTVGATLASGDKAFAIGPYAPAADGVVASMSFQATKHPSIAFSPTNFKMAIYADNGSGQPGVKLGETAEGATLQDTWVTASMVGTVNVVGGSNYFLAVVFQTPANAFFLTDIVAGKTYYLRNGITYAFESPFVFDSTATGIPPLYATANAAAAVDTFPQQAIIT